MASVCKYTIHGSYMDSLFWRSHLLWIGTNAWKCVISHTLYAVHKWCCLDNGSLMNPTRKTLRQKWRLSVQVSWFDHLSGSAKDQGDGGFGSQWRVCSWKYETKWIRCNLVFSAKNLPSCELTYPFPKHFWVDEFPFPKGGIRTRSLQGSIEV